MNSPTPDTEQPAPGAVYTLEILAGITGASVETILQYQEHGIIRPVTAGAPVFDDETVRTVRRIEHVRDTCGMNLAGLKLLTSLLEEVEQLRAELRALRG